MSQVASNLKTLYLNCAGTFFHETYSKNHWLLNINTTYYLYIMQYYIFCYLQWMIKRSTDTTTKGSVVSKKHTCYSHDGPFIQSKYTYTYVQLHIHYPSTGDRANYVSWVLLIEVVTVNKNITPQVSDDYERETIIISYYVMLSKVYKGYKSL